MNVDLSGLVRSQAGQRGSQADTDLLSMRGWADSCIDRRPMTSCEPLDFEGDGVMATRGVNVARPKKTALPALRNRPSKCVATQHPRGNLGELKHE